MNIALLRQAHDNGKSVRKWKSLDNWIGTQSSFCFKELPVKENQRFPEDVFEYINERLSDEQFLCTNGVYRLLLFFEQNWSLLSESQKDRLSPLLVFIYKKSKMYMGRFVVAELLGGYFADDTALSILLDFGRSKNYIFRELVPMGLQNIVNEATDQSIVERAKHALTEMQLDRSASVRREAEEALQRLNK